MTDETDAKRKALYEKWRQKFRENRERLERMAAEGDHKAKAILAQLEPLPPQPYQDREPGEEG